MIGHVLRKYTGILNNKLQLNIALGHQLTSCSTYLTIAIFII